MVVPVQGLQLWTVAVRSPQVSSRKWHTSITTAMWVWFLFTNSSSSFLAENELHPAAPNNTLPLLFLPRLCLLTCLSRRKKQLEGCLKHSSFLWLANYELIIFVFGCFFESGEHFLRSIYELTLKSVPQSLNPKTYCMNILRKWTWKPRKFTLSVSVSLLLFCLWLVIIKPLEKMEKHKDEPTKTLFQKFAQTNYDTTNDTRKLERPSRNNIV